MINKLSKIGIASQDIRVFLTPQQYKLQLLSLIGRAQTRIYITALYLQDDEAGREILHALYQAKCANPQLDIKIFVDFHRAQRGLIGEKTHQGNRALYLQLAEQYAQTIKIYGVAVKAKEFLGVLHLKGFVFDDEVFYTGASINDVYLHQHQRYRLDRYYQISSASLANSFCDFLDNTFVLSGFCPELNHGDLFTKQQQKKHIKHLKVLLKKSVYLVNENQGSADLQLLPLVGIGARNNKLNAVIKKMVQKSQRSLLIFTPYFNLPKSLLRDVIRALKRGVKITIVIGDKTANDFYIADQTAFSTIGIVPYLYEMLLSRFIKRWQRYLDQGNLEIRLWQDGGNSFHLKGLVSDERFHLITGSNLNPRAWSLDLENGLLIDDIHGHLLSKLAQEKENIFQHTHVIKHYEQLESINDYADRPRKLLNRIRITQVDRILKRFL